MRTYNGIDSTWRTEFQQVMSPDWSAPELCCWRPCSLHPFVFTRRDISNGRLQVTNSSPFPGNISNSFGDLTTASLGGFDLRGTFSGCGRPHEVQEFSHHYSRNCEINCTIPTLTLFLSKHIGNYK